LRDGDGLVLDDGAIVRVAGQAESLVEIASKTSSGLVRLAWHIGNRHTDLQIAGGKLRIRRDHVLEEMVRGLGGTIMAIEAPFDPEPAAPGRDGAHHGHDHGA
jgi:urease accessory protein